MATAQGTNIVVAFKKQSGLGVPATGSGGTGLEVRPSQGLQLAIANIESGMMRRSKMKLRPRHGSKSVTTAYETELQVGNLDKVFEGVLGTTATATFDVTESDVTSVTISGTGTTITGASGSFITEGIVAGMMGKFASLSVAGNNGKWFPILNVTASELTVPSGILADNATDTAFTLTIAKSISTPTPYVESYWTFEEHMPEIGISKYGTDLKFNSLNFSASPDSPITIGFGLTGIDLTAPSGGSAPTLTSPTFNAQTNPSSLVLLDGAIYRNGVAAVDLTGFKFGLSAPASTTPVLGSRTSPDVYLGEFSLTGEFTGCVQDGSSFASFLAEDRISIFAHCAEREGDPADFVSFYMGDCSFGGWNAPINEGELIQTIPILGGADMRGAGFAPSSIVISTSAA